MCDFLTALRILRPPGPPNGAVAGLCAEAVGEPGVPADDAQHLLPQKLGVRDVSGTISSAPGYCESCIAAAAAAAAAAVAAAAVRFPLFSPVVIVGGGCVSQSR